MIKIDEKRIADLEKIVTSIKVSLIEIGFEK